MQQTIGLVNDLFYSSNSCQMPPKNKIKQNNTASLSYIFSILICIVVNEEAWHHHFVYR